MLRRLAKALRRPQPTTHRKAAAFEQLEQRQMLAVSPVFAGTKIKGINLSSNGVSTNQTLITVPFTDDINVADASKIRVFGYALNPESSSITAQVKTTVHVSNVVTVTSDENGDGVQEHKYLQMTTDRLMRKGGTIIFNEGALTDKNADTLATITSKTVKGQNKERFTLACRAFNPGAVGLAKMSNTLYAGSPTPVGDNTPDSDATVRANLDNFLNKKVTLAIITQAQKDAAMARYDTSNGLVPPATLRAALFSLTGTFAEGAIASYLDGTNNLTGKPYTILTFANPPDASVPVAQTTVRPSDGRLQLVIKTEFSGESFQALSAWLAHESIHQDTSIGLQEELTATDVEVLTYAQQAQTDPAFMNSGSKLAALENEKLFAFLNSGKAIFPYVGTLDGPILGGAGVFPGQKAPSDGQGNYTSLDNFQRRQYLARGAVSQSTDTNPLWAIYYNKITGKTAPANQKFNDALLADIDSFQAIVSTKQAILLARQFRAHLS
jgi:hypothetical protein